MYIYIYIYRERERYYVFDLLCLLKCSLSEFCASRLSKLMCRS